MAHSAGRNAPYRLTVDVGAFEREDKPVELAINFTEQYRQTGKTGAFDKNTIRVFEVDASGHVQKNALPYQFDEDDAYDPVRHISGKLTFLLAGVTPAQTTRQFEIHLDQTAEVSSVSPLVSVTHLDEYEGEETFKVTSQNATYYYHVHGSGFASMIDRNGNDWISFHPTPEQEDGHEGAYRGIPNIAPAQFHPGRGEGKLPSRLLTRGPIKVSILSETQDRQWGCVWDIYPRYATMTLFKKGAEPYWILYEGTPGGALDETDYWVDSSGEKRVMGPYYRSGNQWRSNLPSPKWVYFGDANLDRVLFMASHETYDGQDLFWHSGEGKMTVFGFGRGPRRGEGWQQLTHVPAHLTIGFAEHNAFEATSRVIEGAYQDLTIQT